MQSNRQVALPAIVPGLDGADPQGWSIYRVADAPLVEGLAYEPVVAEGVAQTDEGMTLAPFAFDLPPLDPGTYEVRVTLDDPSGGEAGPPASETKVFTVG